MYLFFIASFLFRTENTEKNTELTEKILIYVFKLRDLRAVYLCDLRAKIVLQLESVLAVREGRKRPQR